MIIVGDLGVGGERGRVQFRGGAMRGTDRHRLQRSSEGY